MEKIPNLILTLDNGNPIINPTHDWVLAGKGVATQQYDGLCYAVIKGAPYRHVVTRQLTDSVIPCGTWGGAWWGWEPVPEDDAVFWDTWNAVYDGHLWDWTYELCGPEINGDPEGCGRHVLKPHGSPVLRALATPTVEAVKAYLAAQSVEGVVWWERPEDPNCRKVKCQQASFNFKRRSH